MTLAHAEVDRTTDSATRTDTRPLVLVVEQETPAAPGVAPAPPPPGAPDDLQYVGEYTLTWFGLAGVVACFYAALLWRRYRP